MVSGFAILPTTMVANPSTYFPRQYMLAVIPENPVADYLYKAKEMLGSSANKSGFQPPHIKLIPSFEWCDREEYLLVHHIKNIVPNLYSFGVELKGINKDKENDLLFLETQMESYFNDCFETCRMYFSGKLNFTQQSLSEIDGRLILCDQQSLDQQMNKAWKKMKDLSFEGAFHASKISLLKLGEEGWVEINQFHLD